MYNPVSTYRVQLRKEFTLFDLEKIIDYLQALGIKTIYASPIFAAAPGSMHGYDVINPHCINPEIGDEEQLKRVIQKCHEKQMGWLQDIVPNHMAYHPANKWLMSVLEMGRRSMFCEFFDIEKDAVNGYEKIMAPILGSDIEEAVAQQNVRISFNEQKLKFLINDQPYPLNPFSYATFFQLAQSVIPSKVTQWIIQTEAAEKINDAPQFSTRWDELLINLEGLQNDAEVNEFMQLAVKRINGSVPDMLQILDEQFYRICYWRETENKINYRRFFTVNGLICLNVDQHTVFDFYHLYIKELLQQEMFDGLRVDHIDGLNDPVAYLKQLRNICGENTYIVIEKILEPGEELSPHWPIQGTTGYDFLSLVNNLFTATVSKDDFYSYYTQLIGDDVLLDTQLIEKKSLILFQDMQGELENLTTLFYELDLVENLESIGITEQMIQQVVAAFLIHCPVYRYYGNEFPLEKEEAKSISEILEKIKLVKDISIPAVEILQEIFLKKPLDSGDGFNERVCRFYKRCMQFTGPLMAKGVEDTLMYTYNCFIAHNEVGDYPGSFGVSTDDFHKQMQERQMNWPLALNATSTHDTKRGEDARTRLNVISEMFEEWAVIINELRKKNKDFRLNGVPDANEEYLIYQSWISNYPIHNRYDEDFNSRFKAYIKKALREAKIHTDWKDPDEVYEKCVDVFIDKITSDNSACHKVLSSFLKKIMDHGIINSLAQLVLKCTCPGVPDIYQGCESWNFSFVDPDNRRPVPYSDLKKWIVDFDGDNADGHLLKNLWRKRKDGEIKCWLTQKLLLFRKLDKELFLEGEYIPLKTGGTCKRNVLAFMRRYRNEVFVVALPLYTAGLCKNQSVNIDHLNWQDTNIELPFNLHSVVQNVLLNTEQRCDNKILVEDIFKPAPFFIGKGKIINSTRAAGVLLHITSLPGNFAIGDMGPQAYAFADFLCRSNQKVWQVLPLNPVNESLGWSPYSSDCSMAGSELLISPDLLITEGILNFDDIIEHNQPASNEVDFNLAKKIQDEILNKAWNQFKQHTSNGMKNEFKKFKKEESQWIDDYALFLLLKKINDQKPWYEWKPEYKNRNRQALLSLSKTHSDELEKQKWIQFIFFKQWMQLKKYCNKNGIRLFGDLSFYVSHDSADVWANKDFFSIDKNGEKISVAGVPPDAFSDSGQLWGMPVYNWDSLKKSNYKWWADRLKKNQQLFDLLRLDHFRAFADYWEVPANETTAKKGKWKRGPGHDFFLAMKKQLGELPFVAEDLGEITNDVYKLRDDFNLPGMKVLQFAFNEKLPESIHAPHHHQLKSIVYTGTHDNNTLIGWFSTELNEEGKRLLNKYAGIEITAENIFEILGRMAFSSVAEKVILPLQDWLGMDETARMNKPSSSENNWTWRLLPGQADEQLENKMREWTWLYNRD